MPYVTSEEKNKQTQEDRSKWGLLLAVGVVVLIFLSICYFFVLVFQAM